MIISASLGESYPTTILKHQTVTKNFIWLTWKTLQGINPMGMRRVPAQDGLFALILWYVAKTIYWS